MAHFKCFELQLSLLLSILFFSQRETNTSIQASL